MLRCNPFSPQSGIFELDLKRVIVLFKRIICTVIAKIIFVMKTGYLSLSLKNVFLGTKERPALTHTILWSPSDWSQVPNEEYST